MDQNQYQIATLADFPQHYDEVIKLIEKEFHYSVPFSFAQDFAPLVQPKNFNNCFIIIEKKTKQVVAHLGVLPRKMIKNRILIPVIMAGGIVTHKDHRGQNLFSILLEHALNLYKDQAALVILWSELKDFYEKFLFYRAGGIIETGNSIITADKFPDGFVKTNFLQLSAKELNEIKELYTNFNEKYFFTIKRTETDWDIIYKMQSIDLYLKKSDTGFIESYFCYGKGKDLTSIIHEVGTSTENYHELINMLAPYRMWLPESEKRFFIKNDILYSTFIKVLNWDLLNNFFASYTQGVLTVKKDHENVLLAFQGESYSFTEKDMLEGIFGPTPLEEFKNLALSPYIAGTDSI